MIETKVKLWRAVGAAALVSLGACQPAAQEAPAEPTLAAPSAPAPVGGEGEGGEAGEAGAADAYAGIAGAERSVLRRQHLKGFLLIAERALKEGDPAAAGILAAQGVLEVADPAPDEFAGVDLAALREASNSEDPAVLTPALRKALQEIDAAQDAAGGATGTTVRRMLTVARGLYGVVVVDGVVDPTEYQHSLGAALGAADALDKAAAKAPAAEREAYKRAGGEMDRLLGLWPALNAPQAPTPLAEVAAQASRVELALPR